MEPLQTLTSDQIKFGISLLLEYIDRTNGYDPNDPEKEERNTMARQLHNALFEIGQGRMVVNRDLIS